MLAAFPRPWQRYWLIIYSDHCSRAAKLLLQFSSPVISGFNILTLINYSHHEFRHVTTGHAPLVCEFTQRNLSYVNQSQIKSQNKFLDDLPILIMLLEKFQKSRHFNGQFVKLVQLSNLEHVIAARTVTQAYDRIQTMGLQIWVRIFCKRIKVFRTLDFVGIWKQRPLSVLF